MADGQSGPARSHDQRASAFLEALKRRGYDELADHYLASMVASSGVSDAWKSRIPFERAAILIRLVEREPTTAIGPQLEQAKQLLTAVVESQGETSQIDEARMELARLRLAEARRDVADARSQDAKGERDKLLKRASTSFNASKRQFQMLKNSLVARLEAANRGEGPAMDSTMVDTMRRDQLYAELNAALIEYEKVSLYQPQDRQYQEQLKTAIGEFDKLQKEYRERLIGLEAIYYQGVCHQDLGDHRRAVQHFQELLRLEGLPADLTVRALARLITGMCHETVGDVEGAISIAERWLARRNDDLSEADLADMRLALAKAYVARATTQDSRRQHRTYEEARTHLLTAVKVPGRHQTEARSVLAGLPAAAPVDTEPNAGSAEPPAFVEAKAAADTVRQQLLETIALYDKLQQNVAEAENDELRATAQRALAETRLNLQRLEDAALAQYKPLLVIAAQGLPDDELNNVRFTTAYILYRKQRFLEAAVLAEFVARRFPDAELAKQCADLTMASYWQLHQISRSEGVDANFETTQMIHIADWIADHWPQDPSAYDALVNLVNLMIQQGDVAQAEAYLHRIPETASVRAEAELRAGAALWQHWLTHSRMPQTASHAAGDTSNRSSHPLPDETWRDAETLLEAGLIRGSSRPVDLVSANAALALAQLYVETDRASEALQLLAREKTGPKWLVDQQQDLTKSGRFIEQTYRTYLKALIARFDHGAEGDSSMQQALAALGELQKYITAGDADQRRLAGIYADLAQDLRHRLDATSIDSRPGVLQRYEAFLSRVADSADTLSLRNWIAETYTEMADGIPRIEGQRTPDAKRLFGEARKIYLAILETGTKDPAFTGAVESQVQARLAFACRGRGDYKEAIDRYQDLLEKRRTVVNIQVEAAATYQEAGEVGSNNLFELAIKGGRPDEKGENIIWGWERLSKVAASQMQKGDEARRQFADLFFQSRRNIAQCRLLQATRENGPLRNEFAAQGIRAIKITEGLFPDLGGAAWKPQFEELQRELESLL